MANTGTNRVEVIIEIDDVSYYMDTDGINIPLNYQISDIRDIATRKASNSLSITVPETAHNRFIFNSISDLSVDLTYFNPNKKSPVVILVESFEVFRGNLQLNTVDVKPDGSVFYNCVVYSESADFFKNVGEKLLSDIDMSDFNHDWGTSSIRDSWSKDYKNGYFYPFIDTYGVPDIRYINGSLTYSTVNQSGITVPIASELQVNNFQPATYIRTIWDRIFLDAGYTYESDFLHSDTFNNLLMPFSSKALQQNNDFKESLIFKVGKNVGESQDLPVTNPSRANAAGLNINRWNRQGFYRYFAISFDNETPPTYGDTNGLWNTTEAKYTQGSSFSFHQRIAMNLNTWYYGILAGINIGTAQIYHDVSIVVVRSRDPSTPNGATVSGWSQTPTIAQLLQYPRIPFEGGAGFYSVKANSPAAINWNPVQVGNGYAGFPIFYNDVDLVTDVLASQPPTANGLYYTPLREGEEVRVFFVVYADGDNGGSCEFDPGGDNTTACSGGTASFYPGLGIGGVMATYSFFGNLISEDVIPGQPIDYNQVLPSNLKQKDFLTSIIKMFNLYIEPDKTFPYQLNIKPHDQFYDEGDIKDWSSPNKVDISKPINEKVLAESQNKATLFTYNDDSDYYNVDYSSKLKRLYGDLRYVIDNDFLSGEKKIDNVFSPTPLSKIEGTTNLVVPQIFKLNNGRAQKSDSYNFRILFRHVDGLINLPASDYWLFEGNLETSYPYIGHFDDPYNPTQDLNWGQSYLYYQNTPTDNNLVNVYWLKTLDEIANINSRIVTLELNLTPEDIYQFKFSDTIYLVLNGVGGYYKVNRIINYDPNVNRPTRVELLKTIYTKLSTLVTTNNPETRSITIPTTGLKSTIKQIHINPMGNVANGSGVFTTGVFNVVNADNTGIFGNVNTTTIKQSLILGDQNILHGFGNTIVIGNNNFSNGASKQLLLGDNNILSGVGENISLFGSNNFIGNNNNQSNLFIIGGSNQIGSTSNVDITNAFVFGNSVKQTKSNSFTVQGSFINTPNQYSAGRDQVLDHFPDVVENFVSAGRDEIRNLGSHTVINIISAGRDSVI